MGAATKLVIRNHILGKAKALGNTKKGLKEVCSDLVNDFVGGNKKNWQVLSDGTFLCRSTLERIATLDLTEEGGEYRPQVDTCERILRFFDAEIQFKQTRITGKHMNQPKI